MMVKGETRKYDFLDHLGGGQGGEAVLGGKTEPVWTWGVHYEAVPLLHYGKLMVTEERKKEVWRL